MRLDTGLYGHRKRVRTKSWFWGKNLLPHLGLEPASALRLALGLSTQLSYPCFSRNRINTVYKFIAKCQYTDCTRNVLWCQVHSSHIHSNHKTFNYNNSK